VFLFFVVDCLHFCMFYCDCSGSTPGTPLYTPPQQSGGAGSDAAFVQPRAPSATPIGECQWICAMDLLIGWLHCIALVALVGMVAPCCVISDWLIWLGWLIGWLVGWFGWLRATTEWLHKFCHWQSRNSSTLICKKIANYYLLFRPNPGARHSVGGGGGRPALGRVVLGRRRRPHASFRWCAGQLF